MPNSLTEFIQFLSAHWVMVSGALGGIAALLGIVFKLYRIVLKEPDSETYAGLKLRLSGKGRLRTAHETGLTAFLRWLDRVAEGLSRSDAAQKPSDWQPHPLSISTYDRLLLIGALYPIVAAVLIWALFGDPGQFGHALGFGSIESWNQRIFVIASLVSATYGLLRSLGAKGVQSSLWLATAMGCLIGGRAMIFAISPDDHDANLSADIVAIVAAGTFAGVLALAGSVRGAGPIAICISAVVGFGVSAAKAADSQLIVLTWTSLFFVAGLVIAFWAKRNLHGPVRAVAIGYLLLSMVFVGIVSGPGVTERSFGLIIGLTIIPLINVPFDFLSLGATRWLLRQHLNPTCSWEWFRKLRRLYWFFDFLAGLVILVALATSVVVVLEVVNAIYLASAYVPGGAALADIAPVRQTIAEMAASQQFNSAHAWIYFTLFTTMIPTTIHGLIYASSMVSGIFPFFSRHALFQMEGRRAKESIKIELTAFYLTVQWALAGAMVLLFIALITFIVITVLNAGDLLLYWLSIVQEVVSQTARATLVPSH